MDHKRENSSRQLGYAIQVRRATLQMKRKDLAEAAQLSYPYVSEIEKGTKEPSAKSLRALALALGFETPSDFLRWVDEHPIPAGADRDEPAEPAEPAEPETPGRSTWARTAPELTSLSTARRMTPFAVPSMPQLSVSEIEQLREVVISTVKLEIGAWLRSELPALIQDEVARQIEERGLGE